MLAEVTASLLSQLCTICPWTRGYVLAYNVIANIVDPGRIKTAVRLSSAQTVQPD